MEKCEIFAEKDGSTAGENIQVAGSQWGCLWHQRRYGGLPLRIPCCLAALALSSLCVSPKG